MQAKAPRLCDLQGAGDVIVRTDRPVYTHDDRITAIEVAALVAVAVAFVTFVALMALKPKPEYEMVSVVVQPGDTLWGLAREYAPSRDPREAVYIIRGANDGIDPGRLQPGDVVLIPSEVR